MILGLDISSNKTGVACISDTGELVFFDFIDTRTNTKLKKQKFEDLFDKINEIVEYFNNFAIQNPEWKITEIHIEDVLSKFTPGKSSINTLSVLFKTNFAVSYELYKIFNVKPVYWNTRIAASNNGIKIPKGGDKKKIVFDFIKSKYPCFNIDVPNNLPKDSPWFDVSDAVLIARCAWLKNTKKLNQ